ncbi:MAG: hypothetical protein ACOCXQ_00110 [Patescibacteria group bacterium]
MPGCRLLLIVTLMVVLVAGCTNREGLSEVFTPPEPTPDCSSPLQQNSEFCNGEPVVSATEESAQDANDPPESPVSNQSDLTEQRVGTSEAPEIEAVRNDTYTDVLRLLHENGFYKTDDHGNPQSFQDHNDLLADISFDGFHPDNPEPEIEVQEIRNKEIVVIKAHVVRLNLEIPDRSQVTTQYLRVLLKMDDSVYEEAGSDLFSCPRYTFSEGIRTGVFYDGSSDKYVYECMPSYVFAAQCQTEPEDFPYAKDYTGWVRIEIVPNPARPLCSIE